MRIPRVDGVFELLQFHIHAGSEHTLDGGRFGAEIHLVHQLVDSDPARLAVVAVFVEAAAFEDNALFSSLLAGFDDVADATAAACGTDTAPSHWWSSNNRASVASFEDDQLPIYQLVPEGSTFYRYDGGLTTPPCSEIVDWSVASRPLAVSPAQYADLAGLLLNYVDPDTCQYATAASPSGTTSRPVQDLNGRRVRHICPRGYRDPLAAGGRIALLAAAALLSAAAAASAALLWTRRRRPSPPDATRDSRESEQPFTTAFTASLTATS
jgi:carbonic anhydrase